MAFRYIGEIISEIQNEKDNKKKVQIIRKNDSPALRTTLQLINDKGIVWALPKGAPPYEPSRLNYGMTDARLSTELKKLYLFIEGGKPNLKQSRRETLFVQLLEALHASEAELLIKIKDKKVFGIPRAVIDEAIPGLIPQDT